MSVTYFLLLLFCLSLHLHACDARHLSILDKKPEKKSHSSTKSDEKKGFDPSPKQLEMRNNEDKNIETPPVANAEKTKKRSFRLLKVKGKASSSSSGASSKSESLVSVSWRVPRKKSGEKNPGFNLDYSPPKTHPPSHN